MILDNSLSIEEVAGFHSMEERDHQLMTLHDPQPYRSKGVDYHKHGIQTGHTT